MTCVNIAGYPAQASRCTIRLTSDTYRSVIVENRFPPTTYMTYKVKDIRAHDENASHWLDC
ncbi:hypothetical protein PISMIDRAFT_675800, partial [Pisolithus microcarpus 441]